MTGIVASGLRALQSHRRDVSEQLDLPTRCLSEETVLNDAVLASATLRTRRQQTRFQSRKTWRCEAGRRCSQLSDGDRRARLESCVFLFLLYCPNETGPHIRPDRSSAVLQHARVRVKIHLPAAERLQRARVSSIQEIPFLWAPATQRCRELRNASTQLVHLGTPSSFCLQVFRFEPPTLRSVLRLASLPKIRYLLLLNTTLLEQFPPIRRATGIRPSSATMSGEFVRSGCPRESLQKWAKVMTTCASATMSRHVLCACWVWAWVCSFARDSRRALRLGEWREETSCERKSVDESAPVWSSPHWYPS